MTTSFRVGVIAGLLAVLVAVNLLIAHKEQVVRGGDRVLLPLAPVDPRSLMQGDYMALRYDLGSVGEEAEQGRDGHVVVRVDAERVGKALRVDRGEPLAGDEVRIRFRKRRSQLRLGAEAFHFQEGQAALFEQAKYGELRVSKDGESVLVGLRGKDREPLGPR